MQQSPVLGAGRGGSSSSTQGGTVPVIPPWRPLRCSAAPPGPPAEPRPRAQRLCQCRDKCEGRKGGRREGEALCSSTWSFHRDEEVGTEASRSGNRVPRPGRREGHRAAEGRGSKGRRRGQPGPGRARGKRGSPGLQQERAAGAGCGDTFPCSRGARGAGAELGGSSPSSSSSSSSCSRDAAPGPGGRRGAQRAPYLPSSS